MADMPTPAADSAPLPEPDEEPRPDDVAAAPGGEAPPGSEEARRDRLTDLERAVLDLEAATWRYGGAKDHAIRERLGLTPTA